MRTDRFSIFTNDVETTSIWFNTLRDETGYKVMKEGMPLLLDIYSEYEIKSTFYFTGYIAKLYPEIVKMAVGKGHEIASHGKSHLPENGYDVMPFDKQKRHLEYAKKLLEDISGEEVISFRAPALRVSNNTAAALIDTGHKIDSSIAAQRFDFFLSFGSLKKLKWFLAPRKPYRVDEHNLFKKGNSRLVEVPLSAFFLPYVGTTMRIFPRITSVQHYGAHLETRITGKPIVFDIHPNEFIDESDESRVIHRRRLNRLNYIFQDALRSRLKIKNLGKEAVGLYKNEIEFFKNRKYKFITMKDYCKINDLL